MMRCPGCQLDNRESAKFCKECGTQLERKCPSCGYRFESDAFFCDECGYNFAAPKTPLRVDYSRPESYTPKFLADKILKIRSAVEGERKVVTVLFADVANHTAIAEKRDPEEVHQIMDGCFRILMDGIHRYEGTINQFTGDGIMAIFGAPIAHETHAQRACYAALFIQRAIKDYGDKLRGDCGLEFKMRFGINSGLVMIGAIGNDLRMDYTAIGDTTNLASRLESIAEPGSVLVSENTYRLIEAYFKLKAFGPVTLKGKEEPQNAYLLIDSTSVKTRFDKAVSKGLVRFVGRKNSMATLRGIWNRATDGFGQVLGIMGEPGVGKSRLMLEFKRSLADDDIHFLEGRCLPHGGSIAYLPFLAILKSHFSIEGQDDSDSTKNIKEKITFMDKKTSPFMLSAFQQLLSLKTDDESWHAIEPKQRRYHIFETLKCLFIRMSQKKPLVIVLDDLQWMDKTSEEFLSYFIDSISQNPILLVLLYRPEYSHPWEKKSYYSKIGLGQLTRKSSIELISAVLKEGAAEDELEQLILRQSSGNPLFIEELIYSLQENHVIEKKNGRFVLVSRFDSIHIPDTIHCIVAARIDKLDDTLKRITQAASVIGQNFEYRLLQKTTGMGEELKSCLDKLQSIELIYENEKKYFPELEYTFKHALIQEVAYSSLLVKRRKELHVKIGLALELLYADWLEESYEILAYHFSTGEDSTKAYQYLKLSGIKAEFNFSHLEALNFYEKALRTSDKSAKKDEVNAKKLDIYNLMRRPLAMLGYPQNSLKILTEGLEIATAMSDQKSLARFHNDLSLLYTARGDSLLSIAHSEKGFHEAAKIKDIEIMAPLALPLCYAYLTSCKYGELIYVSSKVAELIERLGRETDSFNTPFHLYSFLLGLCGTALGMLGDFQKAEIVCQKGLYHAVQFGHKMTRAFTELQCASVLVIKGEGKTAIVHCQKSIEYSKDIGWVTILSQAWTILGYSHYLLGEIDRAREFVAKGLRIQEDSHIQAMLSLHYWILAMVLFDQGELEEALRSSEKALELSIKNSERRYEGLSRIWIGRILGSKKKAFYREGEQFIFDGYHIVKELGLRPAIAQAHFYVGELYRNAGDESKAVEHLHKAKSMFEEMEMDYWTAKSQGALKGS